VVKYDTVALSVINKSYFPKDWGGFVKGLYHRKAENTDRLSSKRSKWDPESKIGVMVG